MQFLKFMIFQCYIFQSSFIQIHQLKEEVVYHTLLEPKIIPTQKGDALFFMSPSAVESFAMMNEFDTELYYYSIGETTASTLRKKGVQKINTATEASFEAMLEQYATQNK